MWTLESSCDWLTSTAGARSQANECLVPVTFTNQSQNSYTCHMQLARDSLNKCSKLAALGCELWKPWLKCPREVARM